MRETSTIILRVEIWCVIRAPLVKFGCRSGICGPAILLKVRQHMKFLNALGVNRVSNPHRRGNLCFQAD
jgi:hypothetical protein